MRISITGFVLGALVVLSGCDAATPLPAMMPPTARMETPVGLPLNATPAAPTTVPSPIPAPLASPTQPVTPTAEPRRDASYDAFVRQSKAAIEQDDDVALRQLMLPNWSMGPYRAGPGGYPTIDEALAAFRRARPHTEATRYVVDIERPGRNPFGRAKQGYEAVVARWQDDKGEEQFDELIVQRVHEQWRWVALVMGVTYYHSPPLSILRANPWGFLDSLLVGEYRGTHSGNEIPEAMTFTGRYAGFVLRDFSGTSIGVTYYTDVVTLPFQADEPASIGKPILVFAQTMVQDRNPVFLHAHSVSLMSVDNFTILTGTIQTTSSSKRSLLVRTLDNSTHMVRLYETTSIDRTDGCAARAAALMSGTQITALVSLALDNSLFAEQVYILPATGPDWQPTTHIQVFFDGNLFHRRDLRTDTETTFPNGTKWNWKCN